MEQHNSAVDQDIDLTTMSVLLGAVAIAFVALGVTIYFFGEDQSSSMSAANNPPAQIERMMRNRSAAPNTVGRGGQ